MRNFGTLYRFELKKLCHRRMIWAALAILAAAAVFIPANQVMGKMYVSNDATGGEDQVWTHYELVQRQRQDPAGLDGRPLDTDLIQETIGKMGYVSRITMPVAGNAGPWTATSSGGSTGTSITPCGAWWARRT